MSGKLNRYRTGFTLVELIAVIGIISILAAILLVGMGYVTKRTLIAKTKSTLGKLQLAIDQYREDFGFYMPDSTQTVNGNTLADMINNQLDFGSTSPHAPSNYDLSSEILYFFLYEMYEVINENIDDNEEFLRNLPRKRAYIELKQNELRDTDEDGIKEIVDGWGAPILYVAKDGIPQAPGTPEPNNIEPHHDKNPQTYSLYSKGRDGFARYERDPAFPDEQDYPEGDAGDEVKINKDNITNWGTPY